MLGRTDDQNYEIQDGVHRAKAAQLSGMDSIPANIYDADGNLITTTNVSVDQLLSPKEELDLSDPDDQLYFTETIMNQVQNGTARPIDITPGSNGTPISDVPLNFQ